MSLVRGAELIRIPLIQAPTTRSKFGKRTIGYTPLTDDVLPGVPNVDLSYLAEVEIGTPPQTFLLGKRVF
jgi:hypothetical protein